MPPQSVHSVEKESQKKEKNYVVNVPPPVQSDSVDEIIIEFYEDQKHEKAVYGLLSDTDKVIHYCGYKLAKEHASIEIKKIDDERKVFAVLYKPKRANDQVSQRQTIKIRRR